jgi:hypothetical protein
MAMANPKGKITISMNVPDGYSFKGTEVKKAIGKFFNYIVEGAKKDEKLLDLVLSYDEFDKIAKILEVFE